MFDWTNPAKKKKKLQIKKQVILNLANFLVNMGFSNKDAEKEATEFWKRNDNRLDKLIEFF